MPKHRWVPARPIQVPSNHCAPLLAWARTGIVPADIVPGTLPGRFHRPIRSNPYRLDGDVNTDGGNEQACEWWGSWTSRGSSEGETPNTEGQGHQRSEYTQCQCQSRSRCLSAEEAEPSEYPSTQSPQRECSQRPRS